MNDKPEETAPETPKEPVEPSTASEAVEKTAEAPAEAPKATSAPASGDDKILGIPTASYVKFCYILVMIASGYGVFSHLVGLVGVYVPGGQLFGLVGLSGIVLALLGWLAFGEKLKAVDHEHVKYLALLFGVFFVFYVVLAGSMGWFGFLGQIVLLIVAAIQLSCFYVGLKMWQAGQEPTKDSVIAELNSLKDMAISKIKKVDDGVE